MLTQRQRSVLQFIKTFIANHKDSPTTAEIAEGIGIKSRGVVYRYLKALQGAHYIRLIPNRHRNIEVIEDISMSSLPLVGAIAAGQPIEAIEQHESIDITDIFLGNDRYALKVKGDSMVDEGIFDGDIVVCRRSNTANNGQIVVALIDQQEATLKRFYHDTNDKVTLVPANQNHTTQTYSAQRVEIQGIYIGLLRLTE